VLNGVVPASNKVLAVTGSLNLYGSFTGKSWVKLIAPAAAGATSI